MEQSALDSRLAERLRDIYKLRQIPRTLDDFGKSLVHRMATHPGAGGFIERVREGKTALGECGEKHGYSLTMADGRTVEVMCAYDALMTSVLQGKGGVHAACPHCGDKMEARIEEAGLLEASPRSIVFWLGAGPKDAPGSPICDHLHVFPDDKHRQAWVGSRSGELGVSMSLGDAVRFFARSIKAPKSGSGVA